ncbi:MAG: hypothetical protein HYY94_01500 [Gemmatimonadetes bacterium]|nr:hypothetical protein [Gemmatimonadota bacterium]
MVNWSAHPEVSAMIKWVQRRVRFAGAEVKSSPKAAVDVVSVKLRRRSQSFVGRHRNGVSAVTGEISRAAEATLDALRQVVGKDTTIELKTVGPVAALGQSFVLAVVDVTVQGRTHSLMGVCPLSLNPSRDAALAVLDATNRVLGLS